MKSIKSVILLAYSRFWCSLCLFILKRIKLNYAEKQYVEVDGPQIVKQHYFHDVRSEHGGCREAREAIHEAYRLEKCAEEKLTTANVSVAKQKFLERLLFASNYDYVKSFPPRKIKDLQYHFKKNWDNKMVHMIFNELTTR